MIRPKACESGNGQNDLERLTWTLQPICCWRTVALNRVDRIPLKSERQVRSAILPGQDLIRPKPATMLSPPATPRPTASPSKVTIPTPLSTRPLNQKKCSMSPRPPEQDWFEKAEQDLKMGRRTMDPEDALPAMACYPCQPGRGAGSASDCSLQGDRRLDNCERMCDKWSKEQ